MALNKVIEVSSYNSDIVDPSNADMTSILGEPMNLPKGSVISLKNTVINITGQGFSGGVYYFDTDLTVYITIGYYEQNVDNSQKSKVKNNAAKPDLDFKIYALGYYNDNDKFIFFKRVIPIIIKAGSYSPTQLAQYITDNVSSYKNNECILGINNGGDPFDAKNDFLVRNIQVNADVAAETGHEDDIAVFVGLDPTNINDNITHTQFALQDNAYFYKNLSASFNPLIGACDVSLTYDGQTFEWDYMFSPLYEDKGKQNPVIFISDTVNNKNIWCTVRSGCFIIDISPDSFWKDLLGFDKTVMCASIFADALNGNENIAITGDGSFESARAYPFIGLADVDYYTEASLTHQVVNPQLPTAREGISVTTTKTIKGQTASNNNLSGGYYLLEIISQYTNGDYKDSKTTRKIQAIVSRQYIVDGFIIANEDASIDTVVSEDMILSSIRVRILDPVTKELASSIGAKSAFFFQVQTPP